MNANTNPNRSFTTHSLREVVLPMLLFFPPSIRKFLYSISLTVYRMVKRMRKLVSGSSQVARICGHDPNDDSRTQPHNADMTKAFWHEWSTSKKLKPIFQDTNTNPNMDVEIIVSRICQMKDIPDSSQTYDNIRKCLKEIKGVNMLVARVKRESSNQFNHEDPTHEKKLEQLWQLLLPGEERKGGRLSKDWGRIGFQQSDPASDFRGGGILGLNQLIYIAQNRTNVSKRMISEPNDEQARYPWACVGINLTMQAIRILESRKIDRSLYGKSESDAMEIFHSMYADMFEILHTRWIAAKPKNVLDFPPVLKATLEAVEKEIEQNGCLVPAGTQA